MCKEEQRKSCRDKINAKKNLSICYNVAKFNFNHKQKKMLRKRIILALNREAFALQKKTSKKAS